MIHPGCSPEQAAAVIRLCGDCYSVKVPQIQSLTDRLANDLLLGNPLLVDRDEAGLLKASEAAFTVTSEKYYLQGGYPLSVDGLEPEVDAIEVDGPEAEVDAIEVDGPEVEVEVEVDAIEVDGPEVEVDAIEVDGPEVEVDAIEVDDRAALETAIKVVEDAAEPWRNKNPHVYFVLLALRRRLKGL